MKIHCLHRVDGQILLGRPGEWIGVCMMLVWEHQKPLPCIHTRVTQDGDDYVEVDDTQASSPHVSGTVARILNPRSFGNPNTRLD